MERANEVASDAPKGLTTNYGTRPGLEEQVGAEVRYARAEAARRGGDCTTGAAIDTFYRFGSFEQRMARAVQQEAARLAQAVQS